MAVFFIKNRVNPHYYKNFTKKVKSSDETKNCIINKMADEFDPDLTTTS